MKVVKEGADFFIMEVLKGLHLLQPDSQLHKAFFTGDEKILKA